jgi:hypothetical protein
MRRPAVFAFLRARGLWLAVIALTLAAGQFAQAEDFRPLLAAFELSSDQVRPGGTLDASYEFVNTGTTPASGEHVLFVHIRPAAPGDPDIKPATGADFHPLTPTFAWLPGTVVRERKQQIKIPPDFPPGRYRIFVGLYDAARGGRYPLANPDLAAGGQRYRVATIDVLPQGRPLAGRPITLRWRQTGDLSDAEAALTRPRIEPAIQLDSGKLRVELSRTRPVVLGYALPNGKRLAGDLSGYPVRARIGRPDADTYHTLLLVDPACFAIQQQAGEARYSTTVRHQGAVVASFDLVFRVQETTLRAGVENVKEQAGFLLMDVLLPELVAARGPAGQLVVPTQGGRLVRLDRSSPGRHSVAMNWFEMDLCGAVVGDGCAAAIRTRDWDNQLEARVAGAGRELAAGYAVRLALRADARGPAARIRLAEKPSVEVAVLDGVEGRAATWIDAAKWLREDVHGSPNRLYQDTILYKIFCDSPGAKDYTTFDEALGVIQRVHQLAPWLRQVVYLVGWQYQGHDTGYPATDKINARLGGIARLRRLAVEAAKCNAILSYHDNFDDAYRNSPQWDERLIARDPRGELQKGGVWAGGQSYILAFKKYAQQAGVARVQRTVKQMPVRDSYHIDVLSAVPMRRDYHPLSPESTRDSLEGKLAIIREFNRHGVDVTSEGFTAPFVGAIGHGWHFWRRDESVFAGDEGVPFLPMIFHGGPTTYGRGGKKSSTFSQESALYGASYSTDWNKHTTSAQLADPIYLIVAPWTLLRDRKMQDYQRSGTRCRVSYSADTFVEVDQASAEWRVVVDGRTIVENDLAVVPKGDLLAVYARTARSATVRLPDALVGKALRATNAATGEDVSPRVKLGGGNVHLDLPAAEPVLIRAQQ